MVFLVDKACLAMSTHIDSFYISCYSTIGGLTILYEFALPN